jgi:hypothetical protein
VSLNKHPIHEEAKKKGRIVQKLIPNVKSHVKSPIANEKAYSSAQI